MRLVNKKNKLKTINNIETFKILKSNPNKDKLIILKI